MSLCSRFPLYINIIFLFLFIFSQRIPVKSSCSSWGRLLVFVNSAVSSPGRDSLLSRAAAALKVVSTCVASDLCALAWKNLNWSQFCHCFPLQLRAGCASPLFIASLTYGLEIIGLGGTRPEVSREFDTTKSRCSDAIQFPSFLFLNGGEDHYFLSLYFWIVYLQIIVRVLCSTLLWDSKDQLMLIACLEDEMSPRCPHLCY